MFRIDIHRWFTMAAILNPKWPPKYKNPPIWTKFGFQVDYDVANWYPSLVCYGGHFVSKMAAKIQNPPIGTKFGCQVDYDVANWYSSLVCYGGHFEFGNDENCIQGHFYFQNGRQQNRQNFNVLWFQWKLISRVILNSNMTSYKTAHTIILNNSIFSASAEHNKSGCSMWLPLWNYRDDRV